MVKKQSASFSKRAVEYCREHSDKFRSALETEAFNLLIGRFYLTPCLLLCAALINSIFAGIHAFAFLAPAIGLSLAPRVVAIFLEKISNYQRFFPIYLTSTIFIAVLGMGLLFCYMDLTGKAPDKSPPIQIVLVVFLGLTSCYPRLWVIALVNAVITASFAMVFLFLDSKLLNLLINLQFFGGWGLATVFAGFHLYIRQVGFMTSDLERRLNSHLVKELKSLVYPHQLAMLENYSSLTETMPLGPAMGGLGEFDIIDSSKIPFLDTYHQSKNFIFAECYARMLRHYALNPTNLATPYCEGHLVKELGDGFIFSVGFPFTLPEGKNYAQVALDLSLDFLACFDAHNSKLARGVKIQCVIVLIKQEISAFWTTYQVRQFDFKQQCVSKVSRFQEMRRLLIYQNVIAPSGSFILVEDAFYDDLPADHRAAFQKISLEENKLKIRDHPSTKHLYLLQLGDVKDRLMKQTG